MMYDVRETADGRWAVIAPDGHAMLDYATERGARAYAARLEAKGITFATKENDHAEG